jgi:phosphopantothenoylcysteine decarboxylase/phosphopantothenate--cysteine ligase
MAEPLEIVSAIESALQSDTSVPLPPGIGRVAPTDATVAPQPLACRHVLVTSGPTYEALDPVRYLANRSSGKQGHAIAAAAAAAGARVTLVSGPVNLADPAGVEVVHIESARDMLAAVEAALPADVFIAAAAVADWRPAKIEAQKIKKGMGALGSPSLPLVENPDILATVARLTTDRPSLVVGFAAETERVIEHAKAKLAKKGCDLIVANDVSPAEGVMGGDTNTVHLVTNQDIESWPKLDKDEVARRLVAKTAALLRGRPQ